MKSFIKNNLIFFGFIIVSLGTVLPFFSPGFFPMHDDTQVVRVFEMSQALKDGQFPVRWAKDLGYGYGYPLFNFYAPLPYYIGGIANLLGFDSLISTKIMMILGILLSGIFMYLLAQEFWGDWGGLVSGLFYVYASYHAVDIYIRGAVGEFWAMAFIPLIFYGLYRLYKERKWKWVIVGALGYAGTILSHNLTAMIVTPFIMVATLLYSYIVCRNKQFSTVGYFLYAIFLGIGLSSFYWMPAIFEIGYTNISSQIGGGADFRDHFVCWQQLWESQWGFGGSAPGCIDGFSFKIGKLHILATLFGLLVGFSLWKKNRIRAAAVFFTFGLFLVSMLMMVEFSKPIWEIISPLAFVQYPWRFLSLVIFSSSFIAGASTWFLEKTLSVKHIGSLVLILLLFYSNFKLFKPQTTLFKTNESYINEENIKWTTSKISDEYMPNNFKKPKSENEVVRDKAVIVAGVGDLHRVYSSTRMVSFAIEGKTAVDVLVKIAPFPAWKVNIDGHKTDYGERSNGLLLKIPQGTHEVIFSFDQTPLERIATLVSGISFVGLIGGIMRKR